MCQPNLWTDKKTYTALDMLKAGASCTEMGKAFGISRQGMHTRIFKVKVLETEWRKRIGTVKAKAKILDEKKRRKYVKGYGLTREEAELFSEEELKLIRRRRVLFNTKKVSAKIAGVPFDLKLENIKWPKQCPILGIELNYFNDRSTRFNYDSPSFDRMNPKKGYIKGNVYIISHRANMLKNASTYEEVCAIKAYMEKPPSDQTSFRFKLNGRAPAKK